MAKVVTNMEQTIHTFQPSGKWTWKEETNSLEFVSHNPNADRQDKRRRAKEGAKRDRIMSGMGNRLLGARKGRNKNKSPIRQPIKDHTYVTLEDIKTIANEIMTDLDISSEYFDALFHTEQFDDFLLHLLSYFHCFFERMVQEQKLHTTTYIEPSLSEKQAHEDACARLEVCQRLLGQSYCVLVLGMGLDKQHHMACGESRVSSTYKDRGMYETLYSFCTFVVWITFRRREFEVIKKEVGRMLRSDTFNPSLRVKFTEKQENESREQIDRDMSIVKISPAEYRRLHPKRPAIKSIVNQRSPAIVAILPSPKEEAHWLFRRKKPLSPSSLAKMSQEMESERQGEENELVADLTINKKTFKIGILGEPLSQFNPVTLTPLGADNEEEETDGAGEKADTTEEESEKPTAAKAERKASRQQTVMSHTTTEVPPED